jgi:hypothetical protein
VIIKAVVQVYGDNSPFAGGMFAAPGGALFSGLHAIYMYGGLVLFGGYLLYDTQKIIHHSERDAAYDPVNRYVRRSLSPPLTEN